MVEGDNTGGWSGRFRRVLDALLGLAQNRIELFAVELQEEKLRAVRLAVWCTVALTLCAGGLLICLGALALFLWTVGGYWGLMGLALALLSASAAMLWWLRRGILGGPQPFADTLAEFKKDRECLRE